MTNDYFYTYSSFLFHTEEIFLSSDPFLLSVTLNVVKIETELDTEATRSVISSKDYCKLWPNCETRPSLDTSYSTLNAYGGHKSQNRET